MEQISPNLKIRDGEHSYTIKEYIGAGSYGEVWRAIDNSTNKEVAIKFYIMLDEKGREEFAKEYEIAYGLSHKNLLTASYRGVWQNRPFLVMRYCKEGSSTKLVGQLRPNPENEKIIWKFIHDVAAGLSYLHNIQPDPIVHQDIKPDNVLMDSDGGFVITDFGISTRIRSTMSRQSNRAINAGAVAYMGPERFSKQPAPTMASDIWSLGASIYELAMGDLPFAGQGGTMLKYGAEMPEVDGDWSLDLKNVIYQCLAKETWDRLKANELEDYANRMLGQSFSSFDPRATQRKTVDPELPKNLHNQDPQLKPESKKLTVEKKKLDAWIPISLVAIIALIITISATADRREARSQKETYFALVKKCSSNIDKGNGQNRTALYDAKTELEEIQRLENKYKTYYPNDYNRYTALDSKLDQKLIAASDLWVSTAESMTDFDEAINCYKEAAKLHPDEKNKKEYESIIEYLTLVKSCSENMEKGNGSNRTALYDAKQELEKIKRYESGNLHLPLSFTKYNELNTKLTAKLKAASESWANSAKNAVDVEESVNCYKEAIKLYPDGKAAKEFEAFAKSNAYMLIKDIEFCNYNEETIDDYGSTLYANKMRYLGARIIYEGFYNESKSVDLYIKIKNPDKSLKKWASSPAAYSFADKDAHIYYGNNPLYLSGWGNANESTYSKGTYTYEIWYNGKKLFSKNVTLK